MAAKANNKTLWTVFGIAALGFLVWKLGPVLGKRLAGRPAGGGGGGYSEPSGGSYGGYYPPQQQNSLTGLLNTLLNALGRGSGGNKKNPLDKAGANNAGSSSFASQVKGFWQDVNRGNSDLAAGLNGYSGTDVASYGLDQYQIAGQDLQILDNLPTYDIASGIDSYQIASEPLQTLDNLPTTDVSSYDSSSYIDTQSPDLGNAGYIDTGGGGDGGGG